MTFYPTDRLALFIDGANLYSAAKHLGFDIDYRKLLEEFRTRGKLVRAYYYVRELRVRKRIFEMVKEVSAANHEEALTQRQ